MRVGSWRGALVSALVGLTMSACADPDPNGTLDGGLPAERMDADRSDVARIDADMLDAAEDSAHADAARDASMDTGLDEPSDGGTTDDGAAPLSDATVVLGEPGMPCDAARPCAEGSRCVYLAATHTVGYCAPTCTTLHTT
jgi:hypothetical protein